MREDVSIEFMTNNYLENNNKFAIIPFSFKNFVFNALQINFLPEKLTNR